MKISSIHARQILDSRATPTIEVDITLEDGSLGRASVPSGTSSGLHEALELRDGDSDHFLGKSVVKAVEKVNQTIGSQISSINFKNQQELDEFLIKLDGTENKSNLGSNAILGVSLAFAHAIAVSNQIQLYEYINLTYSNILGLTSKASLPSPLFNIMNGGRHANWATDIQEFIVIVKEPDFSKKLETAAEIYLNLGKILEENGLDTDVGFEGGYAPGFKSNEEAFEYILKAIERTGFTPGQDVFLGMDVAASEFFNAETEMYELKTEQKSYSQAEWAEVIKSWLKKYPIVSLEDPFGQDDWDSWSKLTVNISEFSKFEIPLQVIGDDLLVTNVDRVLEGIEKKACNALLVKVNQIGTLTEALQAMKVSEQAGWKNIVSHRSGETEDVSISHIAVGTGCGQIKTGAPSRGERTAKYNELLRIGETLSI